MRLSAKQHQAIATIKAVLSELNPVFWNYNNGIISMKIDSPVTNVDGFDLLSCNQNNGKYICKFRFITK